MLRLTTLSWFAIGAVLGLCATDIQGAERLDNTIVNGGFENGIEGWNYGQWQGLPQPGFIDQTDAYEGQACFVMGLAGVKETRALIATAAIDPTKDYELGLALRGVDLPDDSVWIALLQWGTEKGKKESPQGWVWVPGRRYAKDLITTGGTFPWKRFDLHIYRQGIKPTTKRVCVYIGRNSLDEGELAIDDVSLIPVAPIEYKKPIASEPTQRNKKSTSPAKAKKPGLQSVETPRGDVPTRLLLLDRCDSAKPWMLNLGGEFPGARGALTQENVDGQNSLRVEFDLSNGGRYAGAQTSVDLKETESLVCSVRRIGAGSYFTARVRDATGQMHSGGFHTLTGKWETIELPLNKDEFTSHWGGANDGKIHFPLRQILIAVSSTKGEQGVFWLRDLAVKTRERRETWQIEVSTNQPGQVHFADSPSVNIAVAVDNRLREERNVPISIKVCDLDRNTIAYHTVEKQFAAWQRQSIDLSVETPGPGFFSVVATIGKDTEKETGEGAFGVVRKPERFRQRDADSFFAMHVSDPEIAARIGVHFTRYFHFWRYTESRQGRYTHATDYVAGCLAAGIDVMMCLDYREPSWLKPRTQPNGLPTDDALRHYGNWVQEAVRAHPDVAVFEIQNEPDLELGRSRNIPQETGVAFYSRLVEIAAPIIRRKAPHALIAGSSVSGGDYDNDFSFSRPVLERVGKFIDIYAAHPYASPRTFGPGLHPSWPTENREKEKHIAALELLNQFGHTRRMWIGEKGWAITETSPLAGDVSLSFAQCLAQSLVVARSTPGIEKYFWFLQRQKHGSEGGDYTLFRGEVSLQPMPSAVAYANVAWHLDHCRPMESFRLADDVCVSAFERVEGGGAVAVLWSTNKPFVMEPQFPADAEAFDLFGRNVTTHSLSLTPAPIFVKTSTSDAATLIAAIRSANLKPAQPFEVVSVSPADVNTVQVRLINRTLSTLPVQCRIGSQSKRLILPGVNEPVCGEIHLQHPLTTLDSQKPLELVLSAPSVEPRTISVETDLLPISRRSDIVVDGDPADWQDISVLRVETRDHIYPPDPAGWRGAQDLSINANVAWDADNLYVLVRVIDDVHVAATIPDVCQGDSLQVAIDVNNDATPQSGYDDNDREYGIALVERETRIVQTHPSRAIGTPRGVAKRSQKSTVYEMAIPWSSLGRGPRPGLVFSLNFAANENDGSGRKYAMALTPGIAENKRPGQYRDFYLAD